MPTSPWAPSPPTIFLQWLSDSAGVKAPPDPCSGDGSSLTVDFNDHVLGDLLPLVDYCGNDKLNETLSGADRCY